MAEPAAQNEMQTRSPGRAKSSAPPAALAAAIGVAAALLAVAALRPGIPGFAQNGERAGGVAQYPPDIQNGDYLRAEVADDGVVSLQAVARPQTARTKIFERDSAISSFPFHASLYFKDGNGAPRWEWDHFDEIVMVWQRPLVSSHLHGEGVYTKTFLAATIHVPVQYDRHASPRLITAVLSDMGGAAGSRIAAAGDSHQERAYLFITGPSTFQVPSGSLRISHLRIYGVKY